MTAQLFIVELSINNTNETQQKYVCLLTTNKVINLEIDHKPFSQLLLIISAETTSSVDNTQSFTTHAEH
jgi:hypothetical protein